MAVSAKRPRVLFIDDEAPMREMLKEAFSGSYEILMAESGAAGIRLAEESHPDAIVLDLIMPEFDGIRVCEKLQAGAGTRDIPVIMLTGSKNTPDRMKAFQAGVDDFIGKPFLMEELAIRIDAKLRKKAGVLALVEQPRTYEAPLVCGNLLLDSSKFLVQIGGREVRVSVLEFNLVRFFVQNVGRLLSREDIISSVWKDKALLPRALDWHILTLRRKLQGFDHKISTVYGAGYILKAQ